MAVQLHDLLPGVGPRGPHEQQKDLVYHGAGPGVDHMAAVDGVASEPPRVSTGGGGEGAARYLQGPRSAQTDNSDSPLPRRCGNRSNGILKGIRCFSPAHPDSFPPLNDNPNPRFI